MTRKLTLRALISGMAMGSSACAPLDDEDGLGFVEEAALQMPSISYVKQQAPGAGDNYGSAVSLSDDGLTLVVGSSLEDSDSSNLTNNNIPDSGCATVHTRTSLTSTSWTSLRLKASNAGASDGFGRAVAISADGATIAVGAPAEDSNAQGVGGNQANNTATDSGAVYVYRRSGASWVLEGYLKSSNSEAGDLFGTSVALSQDGSVLVVGATGEDSNATGVNGNQSSNTMSSSGAAYVFRRTGSTWAQSAYFKASNPGSSDGYGRAVSISGDASTIVVGAHFEDGSSTGVNGVQNDGSFNAGAAYVYAASGASWTQSAYLKPSAIGYTSYFGASVDVSTNGATIVVGAPGMNASRGSIYPFRKVGASWVADPVLTAFNASPLDQFGGSVAVTGNGANLMAGSPFEDSNLTGAGGGVDNEGADGSGALYTYSLVSGAWARGWYLKATNTGSGDALGTAVAAGFDRVYAAGAPTEDSANTTPSNNAADGAGAVFTYSWL
jgi:trimeric autotransporter adhesin